MHQKIGAEKSERRNKVITVIIPVLNAMPYLQEALASLEAQTFRDFEVCVWDNGSNDGSAEEARRWIPERLPGRVVSGNPLPLHECLARMVVEAKTEFVARMDGDDWISSDRFEIQIASLERDSQLIGIGGQLEIIDLNSKKIGNLPYPTTYGAVLGRLLYSSPLPHAAMMMRRDAVLTCGNYRHPAPVEDLDLWFRFLKQGRACNLKETIYSYRIHDSGITERAKKLEKHTNAIFECLKKNVPEFFGIDSRVFKKLLLKRYPVAFLPMRKAAESIAKLSGESMQGVLGCPDFLFSARCYTAKWDVLSKVVYRFWGRKL
jgi:glycosyltransferase involved in cell wall biosynthesis